MALGELGSILTVMGVSYRPFIIGWVIVSLAASLLLGRAMSAGTGTAARVKRARRRQPVPPDLRTR